VRRLAVIVVVLTGCAAGVSTPARAEVRIPLSLYVVSDGDDPGSELSSVRTTEEVAVVAEDIAAIWAVAGIVFDPVIIREIEVPSEVLEDIAVSLDTDRFFAEVGRTFAVPEPGVVNGFYVREAGGVNGFAPDGSRVFFVVDEPTVHDERVSSHELGHIMGLRHALDDPGRLMFSGTNGMTLNAEEQTVARYGATGLVGQR
jgi:hypothetical protein